MTNITPGGFRRMLTGDGIPSSEIYEAYQDRAGYLWLATDAGVCRYNGITFTTYTTLNGLPDNTVFHLKEDSQGKMWVQTFTGELAWFDGRRWQPINANPGLTALFGNGQKTQYTFFLDKNDNIIVGGLYIGGCYNILKSENYATLHPIKSPFAHPAARQIWTDTAGGIYGIGEGIYIDPVAMIYHNGHEITIPIGYNMSVGINMRMLRTRDNRVLFSHRETIYEIDADGNLTSHEMPGTIIGIDEDAGGNIWVNMLQAGTLRFRNGDLNAKGVTYLPGYSVSCVLEDAEKGFWFSTIGKGLFYRAGLDFGYMTTSEGLPPNGISCLAPLGNGKVLLGQAFRTITLISTTDVSGIDLVSRQLGEVSEISIEACGSFNGKLFANTDWTYIIDSAMMPMKERGPIRHVKGYTIYPGDDTLILYSHSTILWCDRNYQVIKTCFAPERITAACYQYHTLWLGGLNGLWRMSDTTAQYFGNRYSGLNTRIDDMATDAAGRLWIATRGDGVFVLEHDSVHHFDRNSGLSSNTCRHIAIDEKNNIWVGTNDGISVISDYKDFVGEASIQKFDVTDGLLADEVTFIEVKDDVVWMAGPDGLCWIPANKLLINLTPPPVYISAIIRGSDTLPVADSLVLDYNDQHVRLICEGISLRNSSRITYRYMLIGTGENWINTESREISFGHLEPGDYTFIIYALNSNGIPSVKPASLHVHITTPFTKTWWFYALIALSVASILVVLSRLRANTIRRKAALKSAEERRMAELRLSALRAQMNPHFIFNAINSIQHYILNNDSDKAYGYLAKFSKLIRLVLDQSQHKTITLKQELEILGLYLELERLRFEHPIRIELNVSDNVDVSGVRIPGMLIQPYVENAVWHGLLPLKDREGHLEISISEVGDELRIAIEDNGIGREAAAAGKKDAARRSYGMLITSERLKLLGKSDFNMEAVIITDLKDEKGNAAGTRVEITIRLSNLHS